MKNREVGFTLVELMVTALIMSILMISASIIFPTYVRKGRRIDGINSLLSISLAQERYRSNNTTYGTLAQVWGGVSTTPEGYYTLAITNVAASTYTVTATAVGNQANDAADATSCATLQIAMSSGTLTKSPAACWPT